MVLKRHVLVVTSTIISLTTNITKLSLNSVIIINVSFVFLSTELLLPSLATYKIQSYLCSICGQTDGAWQEKIFTFSIIAPRDFVISSSGSSCSTLHLFNAVVSSKKKTFNTGAKLYVYPTVNKRICKRIAITEEKYDIIYNVHGFATARWTIRVNKKENKQRTPAYEMSSHDNSQSFCSFEFPLYPAFGVYVSRRIIWNCL